MDRDVLLNYLNQYLEIDRFDDYCQNGLQVEGKSEINKITFGTSVSERLFNASVQTGADMILVHHGLFWDKDPLPFSISGFIKKRLEILIKNDLNLVVYHLPLDAHTEVGNNIQILKRLHISPLEAMEVGFVGNLKQPLGILDLQKEINQNLATESILFNFGAKFVEKVLVISGSSSRACEKDVDIGIDTFIGGDIREEHVRICEELKLNFIAAGHYNTEKFGVQALAKHIFQKFNIKVEFIDIPNPI